MNLEDTPNVNRRHSSAETEGRDGQLPDEISALSQIISGARYPGRAWPVRRRCPTRAVVLSLAAAAAAAIVITVGLWPGDTTPRDTRPIETPAGALAIPSTEALVFSVSTDIDPTIAARVVLDIPTVAMPSAGEAGGFKWDLPTINWDLPIVSFPPSPDRSSNHDT